MTAEPASLSSASLPPELLAELARRGRAHAWRKGAVVVAEGEPANAMFVIDEGQARVFLAGDGGREVELNTLGPGEYFGELMLGSAVRTASVQALTRARLTAITRADFEAVLAERPDLAFHLIQRLIERVRALSRNVQGLATMDVYGRVVRLFDETAVDDGGARVVPGPTSRQRIADKVGASRAMVHRILGDLSEGGYIEVARERIVLRKPLPRRW